MRLPNNNVCLTTRLALLERRHARDAKVRSSGKRATTPQKKPACLKSCRTVHTTKCALGVCPRKRNKNGSMTSSSRWSPMGESSDLEIHSGISPTAPLLRFFALLPVPHHLEYCRAEIYFEVHTNTRYSGELIECILYTQ